MSTTLRLDPAHPPLWRDGTTLQLGADGTLVLPSPSRWQQQLLARLESGVDARDAHRLACAFGAAAAEAEAFLAAVAPALTRPDPMSAARVAVHVIDDAIEHDELAVLFDALDLSGLAVVADGEPVLAVAAHVLIPRVTARWMCEDTMHLPFVLHADCITIGPLIVPGQTACAACLADEERRRDPAWPQLMAQLAARGRPRLSLPILFEAARVAAVLLGSAHPTDASSRSVTVGRGLQRSWRSHRPSEDCGCRSLEGSGSAS